MLTTTSQKQSKKTVGSKKNEFFFQPKLTINQPNDVYEQEADVVADKVMRMPEAAPALTDHKPFFVPPTVNINKHVTTKDEPLKIERKEEETEEPLAEIQAKLSFDALPPPPDDNNANDTALIQRKCAHCEEEEKKVQRKEINGDATVANASTENYISSLNGKGRSLSQQERKFFEPRIGYDFSDVQLHTNEEASQSAKSINALAYTHRNNIVFGSNQYQPNTNDGKKLLAHELTHVVQNKTAKTNTFIKRQVRECTPNESNACPAPSEFHPAIEQWQNTVLAPTIYPFRERMYHRLLQLYSTEGDTQSLNSEDLYQAVRQTLISSDIPMWAQQAFIEHAGMRYRSAHGSSLPPSLLLEILDELRNPTHQRGRTRQRQSTWSSMSNSQILGLLQQQHAEGLIPDDAWNYIVRKTDLRLTTTNINWEQSDTNVADPFWQAALQQWTRRGLTLWRNQLMRDNAIHTTSIVCNELAEVAQRHRGISLPGGIAANANYFYNQANQPTDPSASATTSITPYFKSGISVTSEDLRPGASVFFLSNEWSNSLAQSHERVTLYPGVEFPVPWPSSVRQRDRRGQRPIISEGYVDEEGWVYHIGTQITRTRPLATGVEGPEQTQWMKWSHQATVVGRNRLGGITLLETTNIGAGFSNNTVSRFQSQFIFIAWLPERSGGTTSITLPATAQQNP